MTTYRPYRVVPTKRPSLKKQAGLCLLALLAFPGAAAAFVHFAGDARDAYSGGVVAVAPVPAQTPLYDLNADNAGDFPDILTPGETAQTVRDAPKTQTSGPDILGNGPGAAANADTAADLAGSVAPPAPVTSGRPEGRPPSRATIDGRPIDEMPDRPVAPGRFIAPVTGLGPLPAAPLPGLTRMTPFGPVPVKGPGGRAAVTSYAKPFTPPAKGKTVSVVIGGLGINAVQTRRAIDELPPQITLSFASQASGLQTWINAARAKGHEVILELPMEPYNFNPAASGARYTLLADNAPSGNVRNLDYLMSRAQGYFAVTNYLGERFFDSEPAIGPAMKHIGNAGVGFIYDGVGKNPAVDRAARTAGLSWIQNQSVIDSNPSAAAIGQTLQALEASSTAARPALGIGFSYPATIDAVSAWAKDAQKRGVALAPASYTLSTKPR